MDALPLLRSTWSVRTGVFGGLAGTMAIAAAVFRHIARRAADGPCGEPGLVGMEANCAMAQALGGIATGLNLGAIVVGAATFGAAFMWWRQTR